MAATEYNRITTHPEFIAELRQHLRDQYNGRPLYDVTYQDIKQMIIDYHTQHVRNPAHLQTIVARVNQMFEPFIQREKRELRYAMIALRENPMQELEQVVKELDELRKQFRSAHSDMERIFLQQEIAIVEKRLLEIKMPLLVSKTISKALKSNDSLYAALAEHGFLGKHKRKSTRKQHKKKSTRK